MSNGVRVAKFTHSEIDTESDRWKNLIVGSVYGCTPRFAAMESFAIARWKPYDLLSVHQVMQNVSLFNFRDGEAKFRVLNGSVCVQLATCDFACLEAIYELRHL